MKRASWILVVLAIILSTSITHPGHSYTANPQESINLYTGDKLIVTASQPAIQSAFVRGNLSAAVLSNSSFPAKNFTLTTNSTQLYTIDIWLSYSSTYTTSIIINDPSLGNSQYTSYYVSAGALNLTIFASYQPNPNAGPGVPVTWSSLYGWFFQFGNAFPIWIKILYSILGAQFAFVGYRWIKFEDERRRLEGHLPPFDRGNRAYLWIDVAFRILLSGFIISLAIMIGEVLVITIAQYLFFINLNLFSHVDFFSLFFVAALATIIYLAREGLDKFFDLKPIMED
ncbi:MAG TPA: hypothetical protein VE955_01980 [Candidatus Dormibacteraeota bacterium]|nr:hypothetical protein [Candidatus Dormibacteraeota bacterium]